MLHIHDQNGYLHDVKVVETVETNWGYDYHVYQDTHGAYWIDVDDDNRIIEKVKADTVDEALEELNEYLKDVQAPADELDDGIIIL